MEDKQPPSERNAKRKRDEDLPLEEVILSPLFKTPSMLATLLCPVCMNVMQEPMVLSPCGHTFCKMCCGKFAPKKCPLDRRAFGSIIPNHHTKCIMAEVRCKCDFDDCKKLFSVSERADHLKKCDFRPIDCIHGCGTILLQKDFKAHDGICPQKKIPCPHDGCNDRPRRKDYERHCNRCPHRIFQCQGSEMGCKFMGKKSEHSIHEDMCIYVKYQKLKPFEKYIQRHQKNRNLIFFRQLGTEICVHKRELLLEYIDGKEILICGKEFSFDENTTFSDLLQAAGGTMSNVSFRRSRPNKQIFVQSCATSPGIHCVEWSIDPKKIIRSVIKQYDNCDLYSLRTSTGKTIDPLLTLIDYGITPGATLKLVRKRKVRGQPIEES